MAKADFCFNFYDGDATRDMAHMSRLERGAYMDVLIQQRQRGHLSLDDLKKFLSRDFEAVWPSLEWILKKDSEGKFYIEWLENSEIRAKKHSEKQKENRAKALKSNQTSTKHQPNTQSGQPLVEPLGYGDGDVNGNNNEVKGVIGGNPLSDEWFNHILDPLQIENLTMTFRDRDIPEGIKTFKAKARAAPQEYQHRDKSGIVLALHHHLRNQKPHMNGKRSLKGL